MKTLKVFILLALALAALVIATDGRGLVGRAYSCVFPTYRVERVAHVVKCGDTLYSIAYAYADKQDKWDDLRGIICASRRKTASRTTTRIGLHRAASSSYLSVRR